jgi:GNAT superfamily N-acetyltransferase
MTGDVIVRLARPDDLPAIVRLHEADAMGGHGDAWTCEAEPGYRLAYETLAAHPDHALFVAELDGAVVGTMIVSILPGLTGHGATHAQLRSVQVRADLRSRGIGARLVEHAQDHARGCGAQLLELSSNAQRADAHRFYERLGFAKSHLGFKKKL